MHSQKNAATYVPIKSNKRFMLYATVC